MDLILNVIGLLLNLYYILFSSRLLPSVPNITYCGCVLYNPSSKLNDSYQMMAAMFVSLVM